VKADLADLAVVAVSASDSHTAEALEYAASLAPQVLAVHIRRSTDATALEAAWSKAAASPPLIVVDAPDGDCASAFQRALRVLLRTEVSAQITVVLPPGRERQDWRDTLRCPTPVVIRRMPDAPLGL
jgi:hypothetical protein